MHRDAWKVWEDDVAEALNGDKVKASGMTDGYKGDVKTRTFLIDAKETASDGYAVTESFWKELSAWARNEGREPAIAIRLGSEHVYEVAVVSEMSYAERHPSFKPNDQLKRQKQKRMTKNMDSKNPCNFIAGKYRLVAYSFDEFAKEVRDEGR